MHPAHFITTNQPSVGQPVGEARIQDKKKPLPASLTSRG